jgi:hypothetical protein
VLREYITSKYGFDINLRSAALRLLGRYGSGDGIEWALTLRPTLAIDSWLQAK